MAAITPSHLRSRILAIGVMFALSACAGPQVTASNIEIYVQVDGARLNVAVPHGSTVQPVSYTHLTLPTSDLV